MPQKKIGAAESFYKEEKALYKNEKLIRIQGNSWELKVRASEIKNLN